MKICELCRRTVEETFEHHLIPRTRHKNKKNKKMFPRNVVRKRKADLCNPCHSKVHSVFTEKELARDYNTIELLRGHPEIAKFIEWVSKRRVQKLHSKKM